MIVDAAHADLATVDHQEVAGEAEFYSYLDALDAKSDEIMSANDFDESDW